MVVLDTPIISSISGSRMIGGIMVGTGLLLSRRQRSWTGCAMIPASCSPASARQPATSPYAPNCRAAIHISTDIGREVPAPATAMARVAPPNPKDAAVAAPSNPAMAQTIGGVCLEYGKYYCKTITCRNSGLIDPSRPDPFAPLRGGSQGEMPDFQRSPPRLLPRRSATRDRA
jgi:hypothetical protein